MRVVVVGAGMAGLTLAHLLVADGHEVVVLERDEDLRSTGGYRLHLDDHACRVLRRALPPSGFAAIQASAAGPASFRRLTITDHRARPLVVSPRDPARETLMIGRVPLRLLLARGLEDRIRLGTRVTGFTADGDHVAVHRDGLSDLEADLLVAADGSRSVVARQLAGRPLASRVGLSGIAGRTATGPGTAGLVPPFLLRGPALAFGPTGTALFLALHDPAAGAVVDPRGFPDVRPETEPPALVWGLIATDDRYPADVATLDGRALVATTLRLLHGWDPALRELIDRATPSGVAHFPYYAADPTGDLTPYPAGRVVALGDAVHAVPPTGGVGAATAVRDAGHLARRLHQAQREGRPVPSAVAAFHRDLAGYAYGVVTDSLQPVRWVRTLGQPWARPLARLALPAAALGHHLWTAAASGRGAAA